MRSIPRLTNVVLCAALVALPLAVVSAQAPKTPVPVRQSAWPHVDPPVAPNVPPPEVPSDFKIGPDDVLTVSVYHDKELSSDLTVRPDGKITMLLINDIQAAGLTVEQLRDNLTKALSQFVDDPTVTVQVKEVKSLKVYITGSVAKPGPYTLTPHMTVLNLITDAGGLQEFAKKDRIQIIRTVDGKQIYYKFNYDDIVDGKPKALAQNIELHAANQVLVPGGF